MDVDIDKFAAGLADRLGAIVPDGFSVTARDGMLWYTSERGRFPGQRGDYRVGSSGTYVRDSFGVGAQTAEESLVSIARAALDQLQDYVSEANHDPWPGTRAQPQARAGIRGESLHLWYGGPDPETDAVLGCEPIPLADLRLAVLRGRPGSGRRAWRRRSLSRHTPEHLTVGARGQADLVAEPAP